MWNLQPVIRRAANVKRIFDAASFWQDFEEERKEEQKGDGSLSWMKQAEEYGLLTQGR